MLKETARAITVFANILSHLMWHEYSNGVPISYMLSNYDMEITLGVRGTLRLRIGEELHTLDNKSYNTIITDFTLIVNNHIADKLHEQGLYTRCNTNNTNNIEKFVKDNSELIRDWYVKSVNA